MTALEVEAPVVITRPGLVRGMDHDVYLADPVEGGSLSHSGAKTIINRTPALFAYEREHGRPNKRSFDFGHAAHQMVLGDGPDLVVVQKVDRSRTRVDADSFDTKSAQEHANEIRASGGVPVLREWLTVVTAMAAAVRAHPLASKLLEPGAGEAEVSAFAQDPDTGVWLRCRYDWLSNVDANGRLVCVDYKTANDASDDGFTKAVARYGYHLQDRFYVRIARLLRLAGDVEFRFVAQENTPPYLVNVIALDVIAQQIGDVQMRAAIDTFKHCTDTGYWPGYDTDVSVLSLPAWYEADYDMDMVI